MRTPRYRFALLCSSLLCWTAVLTPVPSLGLDPSRPINEYSVASWKDGLPQQTIHSIAQTPDGYLWFATYEGLVRFDADRFVVFDSSNTPGIGSNSIYALLVDEAGTLWIGTASGLSRFSHGRFESLLGPEDLGGEAVIALESDREGGLWLGAGRQLLRYGNGSVLDTMVGGEDLPDSVVRTLLLDSSGSLWVGFESGLLTEVTGGRTAEHLVGSAAGSILALAEDDGGRLWVGTEGGGLFVGGPDQSWQHISKEQGLSNEAIRALWVQEGTEGQPTVWIGTEGGGLNRWRDGQIEVLDRDRGLASELVRSLYQDTEGSLWIGTNGGGVQALRDLKFAAYNEADGLEHSNVRAILEDRVGNLWIGTDGGGLAKLRNGSVLEKWGEEAFGSRLVKALHEDSYGALWVGTTGGGLSRLETDGAVTRYGLGDGLPAEVVYSVTEDSEGRLWVGTNRGVAYRDSGQHSFTSLRADDGLRNENVTALVSDPAGGVWFGTLGGLHRWAGGQLSVFAEVDGLPSARILSLARDIEGRLWAGTDRGLARFDSEIQRFTAYGSSEGLVHQRVFAILDDRHGSFWTSSNRGVMKVSKEQLFEIDRGEIERIEVELFDRSNGLPADQCNGTSQPSAWRTQDGRLWFATVGGAAVVDPMNLPRNKTVPPVVIESYSVDSIEKPISPKIHVGADVRSLELKYTALSFVSPENISFRYRLRGFDPGWLEVGNRRTAYFTNLFPGEYHFEVTARNEDGVENPTGALVTIVVAPRFYETTAFKASMVFLLLCLPWVLFLLRSRRAELNRRRLEEEVAARTEELAIANRRLERQSRLDGLTGVANRRCFDEWLDTEWKRAVRRGSSLALLMIDIDAFKSFNDEYGHLAGDQCLIRVAKTISDTTRRAGDFVARYGGEEFVVILPELDIAATEMLAENLRDSVAALNLAHSESTTASYVTISVGGAWCRPAESAGSALGLVDSADEALYGAKRAGRNRVMVNGS